MVTEELATSDVFERAGQLARSGAYSFIYQIELALIREGFALLGTRRVFTSEDRVRLRAILKACPRSL